MTRTLSMGKVALTVHDLGRVSDFYRHTVGLHVVETDADTTLLGVGKTVLLELRRNPSAPRRSPQEAGLFHTAFLLPTRGDLGAWLKHAAQTHAPIVGAADHAVSEAIYLTDPEGNGVEIYADRAPTSWRHKDGLVVMGNDPLDFEPIIATAGPRHWHGFPSGSTIGHVHLQVGAIAPAEAFYTEILGLHVTCRFPGGTFYAADGYHHHLATNIWNSRGAGPRTEPSTGLADVEIVVDAAMFQAVQARLPQPAATTGVTPNLSLRDPWGTSITLVTGLPHDV